LIPDTKRPEFRPRLARSELLNRGRQLRKNCPRKSHGDWKPPADRPDPLALLNQGDEGRIPELIPIRHGRMLVSPFAYYRGAALAMAVDLSRLPVSGPRVQACGDAHMGNFGCFATPERRIIFSINDLDETLPAPWEWDVKRLAASIHLASRDNGLGEKSAKEAVLACVRSYRERMEELSQLGALEIWYLSCDAEMLLDQIKARRVRERFKGRLERAEARSALEHDFPKLTTGSSKTPVILDHPPLIFHNFSSRGDFYEGLRAAFAEYRRTLSDDRRVLLDRYELRDMAIKVVGVGSVGTFCGILLMMAGKRDPLFLQVKQATASVLEPYAGRSRYANHGERVVQGYRLMQSASDVFLGWTEGREGRHFYIRQLRDAKLGFDIGLFGAAEMRLAASWCGVALALAHARSGEPALIAGYLGRSDKFDQAIARFSAAYADQMEKDHDWLRKAAHEGKIKVLMERTT
jgi:uncharacterized protein (DUF2252 family)